MFTAQNKSSDIETVIGHSVQVKGNLNGKGNIIVEGELVGSVKTDQLFFGGNASKVKGDIFAGSAQVSGEIIGGLKIKGYLEITSSAIIQGDVECGSISIEKGAVINGKFIMNLPNEKPKKEEKTPKT